MDLDLAEFNRMAIACTAWPKNKMNLNQIELSKGNILLVDDHPDNLRVLSSVLTNCGYRVRKALNGRVALTSCETVIPDAILLDINMPDLDGYQVCTALKASEKTRHIPVIFISVSDDVLDKVKAFSVGGADYITKPFHFEEVIVRVENQITIQRLQIKLKEKNSLLEQQNALLLEEIEKRQKAEAALQKANEELQLIAGLDSLTAIPNRRHFNQYLHQEWQRSVREQLPLSLILADIDYFKLYNDTYGHLAGDFCLKQVAQGIKRAVKRSTDLVARYGGEEFAVLLPNTNIYGSVQVAGIIQLEVQQLKIVHVNSYVSDYITLSLGICSLVPNYQISSEVLIANTDKALYQAKEQGRDRSCSYTTPSGELTLEKLSVKQTVES